MLPIIAEALGEGSPVTIGLLVIIIGGVAWVVKQATTVTGEVKNISASLTEHRKEFSDHVECDAEMLKEVAKNSQRIAVLEDARADARERSHRFKSGGHDVRGHEDIEP